MPRARVVAVALYLVLGCLTAFAQPIQFVAFGDMPYGAMNIDAPGQTDAETLQQVLLPKLAARADVAFVVHLGDIGQARDACNPAWFRQQSGLWNVWIRPPYVFSPGDNDWADCEKPEERLKDIRRTLISRPNPIDSTGQFRRQDEGGFVENAMWRAGTSLFVTIHSLTPYSDELTEVLRTVDANSRDWLYPAFSKAQSAHTLSLVLFTHANWFDTNPQLDLRKMGCNPVHVHAGLCRQFEKQARKLRKPVLLAHGDSTAYCLDQPFGRTPH